MSPSRERGSPTIKRFVQQSLAERAYWVPLWTYSTNYAMNKELKFDPTSDELLRFYDMAWN